MSDEDTKKKHSKRIHTKYMKIAKQVRLFKMYNNYRDLSDNFDLFPHWFHKRHAFNCGSPRCWLCGNPRKFFNERTLQEKSFDQKQLLDE